jgi:bacterioferritin-associated ferredoxin
MRVKDKEVRKAIRLGIRTLILQEVRLLRLERAFTPNVMIDEMSQSIRETKNMIIKLTRSMENKERTVLLKRMIRQAVDQEIDRAIELRKTKCVRCLHGRFYDEAGTAHVNLPVRTKAEAFGCDKLRPSLRKSCRRFVEISIATSLDQYLNEMILLYEFRDLINRMEEVWKNYLTK